MDGVSNLLDRPMAYNNVDGVGELSIGFMCLAFGVLSWLQVTSREGSFWNRTTTLCGFLAVVCSIIHFGSKAIKTRITYPRTGFVQYRRRDAVWRPIMFGLAVSFAFLILLFLTLRGHWDLTAPVTLVGLILAGTYGYQIARAVRWKWIVVWLMAAVSIVLAVLPAKVVGSMAQGSWITDKVPARIVGAATYTLLLNGVMVFISGGISFWLYLRKTKAE